MHEILQRQYINYIIFVLESFGNGTFNKGKLFNAGFVEAMKLYKFDCVILHDVDLIPENDKNIYECSKQPRHMALYINIYNYTFGEPLHLGGATAITVEQFKKINGFNNNFWGHGYEDNDLYSRVYLNNLNVVRYPFEISRYYSFEHERDKLNPINKCNLYLTAYYHYKSKHDGINNLKYKFITLEYHKLFTKIVIDLLENFSRRKLNETIKRYNICDGGGKKELLLLSP
uniref:Beta-1,4-galactosyltransferase n=1 Tax=Parastrongyloides trichosuri TaxID=131310 RepID=A0A0N4ZI43_PARTI